MLKILFLAVALNPADLPYAELEKFYWDCDTMFMKGELGGQDTWSCLSITEEFQKHFGSRDDFMIYWHDRRRQQWSDRGYYPPPDFI
jgi:hypothetical protein